MKKATRKHTKDHNRMLILRAIYKEGEISRAELARTTRLTKTSVSSIVSDLMSENLVEESGRGPSEGGKPPVLLSVPDDSRHLIGLDLANSVFHGGVINMRGEILHRLSKPLSNKNGEFALKLVFELADELNTYINSPLLGIGIGSPGLIDGRNGVVRQAVNLDWQDLPLRDLLQARYHVPVYIANDSHAAALGEYSLGPDRGTDNLVVVKVGRGISAGIVLNGRLHYGDGSGAGEIGHIKVVPNGDYCTCGHLGCLETVASSRAVIRRAQEIFATQRESALHKYAASSSDINTEAVLNAFRDGDTALAAVVEEVGCYLGTAVANLIGALNVQNIIIAGSLARLGQPLLDAIRRQMRASAMSILAEETNICPSEFGQDLVMLGAASLLLSNELGIV